MTGELRKKARIITIAWSKEYIGHILSYLLPSLLAPGNVPYLHHEFDCEFVVVTDSCNFHIFEKSPVVEKLKQYCRFMLKPVDDLLSPWYGITLTHAFFRGHDDLGAAITDTYLFFANADFVLADGAYRTVAEKLRAGKTKIFAPSYCTITEDVASHLDASRHDGILALGPAAMSELILRHRHPTIDGKTINAGDYHLKWIDQFYWRLGNDVLLARQMPISLICMKPERALAAPNGYWDYGIVDEYCPSAPDTVIGDSMEFAMLELRARSVAGDEIIAGIPEKQTIANSLSMYTTGYMQRMGHYPLVLRAGALPVDWELEAEQFDGYVRSVLEAIPSTNPYHGNPMWMVQIGYFKRHRQSDFIRRQLTGRVALDPLPHRGIYIQVHRSSDQPAFRIKNCTRMDFIYNAIFGQFPRPSFLNPYWPEFRHVRRKMRPYLRSRRERILLVADSFPRAAKSFMVQPRSFVVVPPEIAKAEALHAVSEIDCDHTDVSAPFATSTTRYKFDFVFCEFTSVFLCEIFSQDVEAVARLYRNLRGATGPGGRIVIFSIGGFESSYLSDDCAANVQKKMSAVVEGDSISFRYTGYRTSDSLASRIAFHTRMQYDFVVTAEGEVRPPRGGPGMMLDLFKVLPATLKRNITSVFRDARSIPTYCTGVLIDIRLSDDVTPLAVNLGK